MLFDICYNFYEYIARSIFLAQLSQIHIHFKLDVLNQWFFIFGVRVMIRQVQICWASPTDLGRYSSTVTCDTKYMYLTQILPVSVPYLSLWSSSSCITEWSHVALFVLQVVGGNSTAAAVSHLALLLPEIQTMRHVCSWHSRVASDMWILSFSVCLAESGCAVPPLAWRQLTWQLEMSVVQEDVLVLRVPRWHALRMVWRDGKASVPCCAPSIKWIPCPGVFCGVLTPGHYSNLWVTRQTGSPLQIWSLLCAYSCFDCVGMTNVGFGLFVE